MAEREIVGTSDGTASGQGYTSVEGAAWYLIKADIGRERLCDEDLGVIEGVTPYLPLVKHRTVVRGGARVVERPLFDGYMFALFNPNLIDWPVFNRARGLVGLVRVGLLIVTVSERDIRYVVRLEGEDRRIDHRKVRSLLEAGDIVKILAGPFKSFGGQVTATRIYKGIPRATVEVEIFGRTNPVELDEMDLARA